MIDNIFAILAVIDSLYWEYVGFLLVVVAGIYFSFKSDFLQFRTLFKLRSLFADLQKDAQGSKTGTSPIKLFFTSIGGMVGIGNIAVAATAVTLGGPGSVLWMWVASFAGMLIKYSDIYLGVKYRVANESKGYDGGPMYYLQRAFNSRIPSYIVCILFCIYGVEVLQFTILSDEISHVMKIEKIYVVVALLVFIFFSSVGGVKRLANLCSAVMPPFLLSYFAVGCCIFYQNFDQFVAIWPVIIDSALNGHAAVGGFAATSMLAAAQHGTSRAVYSGDIGIGYDSILQSETSVKDPAKQARIAVIALFSDTLICTISCLIVLVTGIWTKSGLMPSRMVPEAVSMVLPHSDYFMLLLLFVAGVTTITAYFVAGMKCAKYISVKYGEKVYIVFGLLSFLYFSQYDQTKVLTLMSLSGGLLVFINLIGILTLRKEIVFNNEK